MEADLPRLLRTLSEAEQVLRTLSRTHRREIVDLPDDVWAGPSKMRATARSLEIAEFARRLGLELRNAREALHTHSTSGRQALVRADEQLRLIETGRHAAGTFTELQNCLNEASRETALLTNAANNARAALRTLEASHHQAVLDLRDGTRTSTASRTTQEVNLLAQRIVTSKSSTPAQVAAALLGGSGALMAAEFRRAIARKVFSPRFQSAVKRLLIAKSPRADLLNRGIADWERSKDAGRRHPVFIDLPVFKGAPRPTDIIQGALGDCWLLAALATVAAHDPAVITRMVEDNFDGTYTVRFVDGVSVVVSGDVWLRPDIVGVPESAPDIAGQLLENAGSTTAQWPWIIEKAFAQRFGSFDALDGGRSTAALDLIVSPSARGTELFEEGRIVHWETLDIPTRSVSGFTPGGTIDELDRSLLSGMAVLNMHSHAYAVLGTEEFSGHTWVRLFNPYSRDGFAGPIGNVPVRYGAADDGVMLIRLQDLTRAGLVGWDVVP